MPRGSEGSRAGSARGLRPPASPTQYRDSPPGAPAPRLPARAHPAPTRVIQRREGSLGSDGPTGPPTTRQKPRENHKVMAVPTQSGGRWEAWERPRPGELEAAARAARGYRGSPRPVPGAISSRNHRLGPPAWEKPDPDRPGSTLPEPRTSQGVRPGGQRPAGGPRVEAPGLPARPRYRGFQPARSAE